MPKVRIKIQPSGLYNGYPWPEVGETIDVPQVVADDLVAGKHAELVKDGADSKKKSTDSDNTETRPSQAKSEKR